MKVFTGLFLVILIVTAAYFFFYKNRSLAVTVESTSLFSPPSATSQNSAVNNEAINSAPITSPPPASRYVFPLIGYNDRITNRGYSDKITVEHSRDLPCGDPFSGFHTGDDLEVLASELGADVPVFAIAEGRVRSVDTVGGYGGLIIIDHILDGEKVQAYYGHVDIANTWVSAGDPVMAGEKITLLGDHCSSETSSERKHLHFSLRKGLSTDVRGYVPDLEILNEWVDPQELLTFLEATDPRKSD